MAEAQTEPLIAVAGLCKSFDGIVATDHLDLTVMRGEIHAIIGPNGAGKTTLINQISGSLRADAGKISLNGHDITTMAPHGRARLGLARSFQITSIFPDFSVLENVALSVQAQSGHSYRFWQPAADDTVLNAGALDALERVGLALRSADNAGHMSHGEHRQLEIAIALATNPSALLLDEPMAGMGRQESARMVEIIRALRDDHGILLIEHDMDAVFALADRITVLVHGRAIASGTPEEIRTNQEVERAYLGDAGSADA
ncbi:MAG: ABC transporter ATP-binding protein [Alphaproteobacteria bacterium]|jgi:branched-chain amino acid transport system ATP-binding protein